MSTDTQTRIDYVWTDGIREDNFVGKDAFKRAQAVREIRGQGKIWRRVFDSMGFLREVTDATDWVKER